MIVRLVLPKMVSTLLQNLVGSTRCGALQAICKPAHFYVGSQEDVNMIRHHDIGVQGIVIQSAVAARQFCYHAFRDVRIL